MGRNLNATSTSVGALQSTRVASLPGEHKYFGGTTSKTVPAVNTGVLAVAYSARPIIKPAKSMPDLPVPVIGPVPVTD
jgi:hypothetical protein